MEQKGVNDFMREFEEYQRSSYTEQLREQLAKWVEAGTAPMAPVVICKSRANGRTEMEFPYLMPLPLEAPIYELDLAETCPVCGGAKHRGEGVCGWCLLRGRARPGVRL